MSPLPSDDQGWFQLVYSNQAPLWRVFADATGGRVLEDGDIRAAIVPASPERSFFNSVFFEDSSALVEALPRLADAYDEAGVNAWTVWTSAEDDEAATGLQAAGHVLDAEPRAMGMELTSLNEPEPDPELTIREEADMEKLRTINEVAYGYPAGDFPPMEPLADTSFYLADLDGVTVGTVGVWDRGEDAEVIMVATLPEARNRGVAKRLMAHALADQRERGKKGSTLIATKLGLPVYENLGYRDFGGLQMWERRRK